MSNTNQNPIQKANMMYLSKGATNKDQSLKIQMMVSIIKDESSNAEKIWKKTGFLKTKKVALQLRNHIFQRIF